MFNFSPFLNFVPNCRLKETRSRYLFTQLKESHDEMGKSHQILKPYFRWKITHNNFMTLHSSTNGNKAQMCKTITHKCRKQNSSNFSKRKYYCVTSFLVFAFFSFTSLIVIAVMYLVPYITQVITYIPYVIKNTTDFFV